MLGKLSKAMVIVTAAALSTGCANMEKKDWAILGAAIVGAAAVAHYANKGGGGAPVVTPTDYQWDWDQYYQNFQLVWSCRGVQSGQFAEQWRCNGLPQTDYRWPAKTAQL